MAETIRIFASEGKQGTPEICPKLARLIAYLSREYAVLAGRDASLEDIFLTAEIIKHLRPLFAGNLLREFAGLRAFLREHRGRMAQLYRCHGPCPETASEMLFNPAALLIFYLLETRCWDLLGGWRFTRSIPCKI